jgi:fumarylacetoacetate (FAA) hydrolase
MAFERHVATARGNRGLTVPDAWYSIPVFYFSNPGAVYRDGDAITRPADTTRLDYELEMACVIGAGGRPEGFTIMNDFSARDLQFAETPVGLGPAKGKDFATTLGPVLVSADEVPADLDMRRSRGSTARSGPTRAPAGCSGTGRRSRRPRRATRRGSSRAT